MHYVMALGLYSICMVFAYKNPQDKRVIFALLPLILLVIIRGNVGTDTTSYLDIINTIINLGTIDYIEYGFILIVKLFAQVTSSPMAILVVLALISTALLISSSNLSERSQFVFLIAIVPIFYLDMTMNGVRYGLSFSFAMYSISLMYQKKYMKGTVFGVTAVLFHSSGLLLFIIMGLLANDKEEFRRWAGCVMIIAISMLAVTYVPELTAVMGAPSTTVTSGNLALGAKLEFYQTFGSPNWYSGLSTLLLSLGIIFVFRKTTSLTSRQLYILLFLIFVTFIVAKFSYAGLRLQSIVLFAMLVAMQFKPEFERVTNQIGKKLIIFVGVVGMLFFVKNIIQTEGQGSSPFLPWHINHDLLVLYKNADA